MIQRRDEYSEFGGDIDELEGGDGDRFVRSEGLDGDGRVKTHALLVDADCSVGLSTFVAISSVGCREKCYRKSVYGF